MLPRGHDALQKRLLQVSAAQTERRAAETVAETEARLDRDKERHGAQRRVQPQTSLLEQLVVRHKMSAFHRHLSKLEVAQCITCCEAFPGLQLRSLQSADMCNVIAFFLAQARPIDDYHLPSIECHMAMYVRSVCTSSECLLQ